MVKGTYIRIEGWQRILLLIVPYFFIVVLFQLAGVIITKTPLDQINANNSLFQDMIITIFNGLGTFIVIFFFVRYVDKEKFLQIGLRLNKRLYEIVIALLTALISVGGGFIILLFLHQIEIVRFGFEPQKIVISIIIFGIVAFTEEILFRGYILKNLMISFSKFISLVASSFIFVLMHAINPNLNWISILSLFLAGLALGISYIYTKNLWFPIALHFGWNFFQTHFGYNVSGQNTYSIIETTIVESTFLNGGEFGFEGSILSLIFESLIIIMVFKYYNNRREILIKTDLERKKE